MSPAAHVLRILESRASSGRQDYDEENVTMLDIVWIIKQMKRRTDSSKKKQGTMVESQTKRVTRKSFRPDAGTYEVLCFAAGFEVREQISK
jgi:hypothetical protein